MVQGLPMLESTLRDSFDGLETHHQLSNQYIKILNHDCQAHSVTCFTATIMGTGNSSAQVSCNGPPIPSLSLD